MANLFDEAQQSGNLFDEAQKQTAAPASPNEMTGIKRVAHDATVSLGRGMIGLADSALGLADIPTGGAIGRMAQEAGFDTKKWAAQAEAAYSTAQQQANAKVRDAKGFMPTVMAAVENPSTIAHAAIESLPMTLAGGALAKGAQVGLGAGRALAAGLGEGAVTAGSIAEGVRQNDPNGELSAQQAGLALLGGATTGIIGAGSAKLAGRMGINDFDQVMLNGEKTAVQHGLAGRVGRGMLTEGVLEELPQSMQEQAVQNLASGNPVGQGVAEAGAMGMLTGGLMGGGMNVPGPLTKASALAQAEEQQRTMPIKSQEAAQARANRMTSETGRPHEVAPHPSVGGAFTVIPTVEEGDGKSGATAGKAGSVGANVPQDHNGAAQPATGTGMGDAGRAGTVEPGSTAAAAPEVDRPATELDGAGHVDGTAPVIDPNAGPLSRAAAVAPAVDQMVQQTEVPQDNSVPYTNIGAGKVDPANLRMAHDFDRAAHEAAASSLNDRRETPAMIEANNRKLGQQKWNGLTVQIENPQGSTRSGKDEDGNQWSTLMTEHYGRIKATEGADSTPGKKEGLDIFMGPNPDSTSVFVVDQTKKDGSFDEHKIMAGFDSLEQAKAAYYDNYQAGWTGGENIHATTVEGLKTWIKDGDTKSPFGGITAPGSQPAAGAAPAVGAPASPSGLSPDPSLSGSTPAPASLPSGTQPSASPAAATAAQPDLAPPVAAGRPSDAGIVASSLSPDKEMNAEGIAHSGTMNNNGAENSVNVKNSAASLPQITPEVAAAEKDKVIPAAAPVDVPTFSGVPEAAKFASDNALDADVMQHPSGQYVLVPKVKNAVGQRKADNEKVAALNAGRPAAERVKAVHDVTPAQRTIRDIAKRAFGLDVVYVTENPVFFGVAHKGTAFVDHTLGDTSLMLHTTGHETMHGMQQTDPQGYAKLKDFVMSYVNGGVVEGRLRKERESAEAVGENSTMTKDGARDEVMADINGALWSDPKFWSELAAHDQSLFRKVAYKFMELLTKAIDVARGSHYDIDRMVKDRDAVRTAIAKGWAEYNATKEKGNGQRSQADDGRQAAKKGLQERRGVRGSTGLVEQPSGQNRGPVPLKGLPATIDVDGREVTFGPFAPARAAAARYMEQAGLPYRRQTEYVKLDRERARALADQFEAMAHDPSDPATKASYEALIRETVAQYEAVLATGLKIEFIDYAKTGDPYGNPRNAILDVVENNHLWVFSTRDGFGGPNATLDVSDNPLLAETQHKISGQVALANDLFRVVHDYFGHIKEGIGFRAEGEENAWQQHVRMFSPEAIPAMTTETRGQNSWVNFGPYAEKNKTANGAETEYAAQKIGLMPSWAYTAGRAFSRKTLPTRIPTGKGAEAPLSAMQIADYEALQSDASLFEKVVDKVLAIPGMQSLRRESAKASAEAMIERLKDNLLALHDAVPQAMTERTKLWYDGARAIAEQWAKKYGIDEAQAAGMLAVLSPQKDWYMNVTMAERILDIVSKKQGHAFDKKMQAAAFAFLIKESGVKESRNLAAYKAVQGKTLAEVMQAGDPVQIGLWVRAYDEAHHSARHAQVTPEGGFKSVADSKRAWGQFDTIGKAVSVYMDGSPENISDQLGGNHKVRNFYNNIYAPKDERFVTIDTHAVAAAHLIPFASEDGAVKQNFGTVSSRATGINGTYPLYVEAYRRAAKERGVLPREMQSITWEAVRGLFPESFKTADNKKAISAIWSQLDDGKITLQQAREQVGQMAGGINAPTWHNERDALSDKTYRDQREPFSGTTLIFEVAPDPRNTALKARWDSLPADVKSQVTHEVAFEIAAKAMASLDPTGRLKGELHTQYGGWMDDTSPSLSIMVDKYASNSNVLTLARVLGSALQQQAMMVTSPKPFKGSVEMSAIHIPFGMEMSQEAIHNLYQTIRTGVTANDGAPIFNGHTSNAEGMVLLVDKSPNIGLLAQRVAAAIGDSFNVASATIHAAFPEKGENDYGLHRTQTDSGDDAESSVRALADQLRAESQARIESILGQRQFSRRADGHRGAGREGVREGAAVAVKGRQPDAAGAVVGIHYGQVGDLAILEGGRNGSGISGREQQRLKYSKDARIKRRVYFYPDTGAEALPAKEGGLGNHVYAAKLGNLYDVAADPRNIFGSTRDIRDADDRFNTRESMIVDAGYDGYAVPTMIVVLDADVPVTYLGSDRQFSRKAPATPEFKAWFGNSKIVDESGEAKPMYHGTSQSFEKFRQKQADAIFLSDKPTFAEDFANMSQDWMIQHADEVLSSKELEQAKFRGIETMRANIEDDFGFSTFGTKFREAREAIMDDAWRGNAIAKEYMTQALKDSMPTGQNIMPLYVKAEKLFDYERITDRLAVGRKMGEQRDLQDIETFAQNVSDMLAPGPWDEIERWDVQQAVKALGYDSFYVKEHGVKNLAVYHANQVKSATGNRGTFDPNDDRINYSRKPPEWINTVPGMTDDIAKKVGAWVPQKTFKERWDALKQDFGKKAIQGMFDQFAPIKELDMHAYMLARMSKSQDGAVEAMLMFGKPDIDGNGALTVDTSGGFKELMAKLQGEQDRFFAWVAGNRAERLAQEGRENLLSLPEIAALKNANQGAMADGTSRAMLYAQVNTELQAFNKSVLDIAEKTGVVDGASRAVWEKDYYVPFYRLSEDDETFMPMNVSGLTGAKGIQKLKGGTNDLGDLMQNTVLNWAYLLSASLKNQAATFTLREAEQVGAAHQIADAQKGSVFILDQGQKVHFMVDDPHLATAVSSIAFTGIKGAVIDAASWAKRALSFGVTFSPSYRLRNIIRDQLQAVAVNPLSFNVFANLVDGVKMSAKDSPLYSQMLAGGALIRMGTAYEGNRAAHLKRQIAKLDPATILDTEEKVKHMLANAFDAYMEGGERFEAATRAAIYKQAIDAGKTHLEASYLARDSMDFGLQGSWQAVRLLSQVVPFFNARMQGMYKLGRGSMEDKKRFAIVVGAATLATVALMMANAGDDDWDKREEWDRNNFWWFKAGGVAYRIPKPFEIGAIATLAERGAEMVMDGMDEKARARFAQQALRIVLDQLSMNPTPQLVKPALDVFANKDTFRGRPIESMGDERLSPAERIGGNTTALAQLLGKNDVLSPKQIDYLIQGYFGWLGSHAAMSADFVLRPAMGMPEKATRRLDETFIVGDWAKELPSNQSRYVSEFYEQSKSIERIVNDIKHYQKLGDTETARELRESHKDELKKHNAMQFAQTRLSRISQRIRAVESSTTLSPEQKRQEIDRLNTQRNALAQKVVSR